MNLTKIHHEELRSLPARPQTLKERSTKRRFVSFGRNTSDGSVQSGSSTCRSSTGKSAVGVAVRQPSNRRISRHTNRLSGVFLRGPASSSSGSMALATGLRLPLSIPARKGSIVSADALMADDPSELSNQMTAPGILKIFGNDICEGAQYKSVLATTQSSARELVKEALERYGLDKEEAGSYVLCDTIGSIGLHQWRTEGLRVVGDSEKPLLLQSLWKPREGFARRFEIQKRSSVEEKTSKEKDTITAGINAQARKLQKSRSRVTSTLIPRTTGQSQKLWRSKSEMDLLDSEAETKQDHKNCLKHQSQSFSHNPVPSYELDPKASPEIDRSPSSDHSLTAPFSSQRVKTETLCPLRPRAEQEGEESEKEETESSDDNTTQYSIHPPHDCPYLLLLQGCSLAQDFVVYLLAGRNVLIGRQSELEEGSKADIVLFAPDIAQRHCAFVRQSAGSPTVLLPFPDAMVTRNGEAVRTEVQLNPGDVIGMGQSYLFLFKDPVDLTHKVSFAPSFLRHRASAEEIILCSTCAEVQSSISEHTSSGGPPLLESPEGHALTLKYEAEDEHRIVGEIVAMGNSILEDRPALTTAFLLRVCVQSSAVCLQTSDLRRLLLLMADGIQTAVWACTKDLAATQPEALGVEGLRSAQPEPLSLEEAISGLRPLVVWMSNSLELLHFIQNQLPLILEWRTRKEEKEEEGNGKEEEKIGLLELRLSCVRSASEETVSVLEEVVLLAFQQCVYYITKVLYPILPRLLDCNPFKEAPDQHNASESAPALVSGGLQVPGQIEQVVEVLSETQRLLLDCQLHPQISSQLFAYLFYFINASLFNSLMERGSEPGFYQWSTGVRMRVHLDLVLHWAHASGLGEVALEQTRALSSAIGLLATPRNTLLQTCWASLRSKYPALNLTQLNHLLSLYSPASPCRHTWAPSERDRAAAHNTDEILQSFDTHHPVVLPDDGYRFQLRRPVVDSALREQLDMLEEFISDLSKSQSDTASVVAEEAQGVSVPLEPTPMDILQKHCLDTSDASAAEVVLSPAAGALPPSPPSPSSPPSSAHHPDEFSSCAALLLSQKLRNLQLQTSESDPTATSRSVLDPSCLLTPPNTPRLIDPAGSVATDQSELHGRPSGVDVQDEGGLVFKSCAALKGDRMKSDGSSMTKIMELEEEEEEEEEEEDEREVEQDDEIFSLELKRGEQGLGLALVDTRDTSLRVKGVFIRAVVPDSPAACCKKLVPGDRILAVNGVSLLGKDYQRGMEQMHTSDRLRLLVARSEWMIKALQAEC